jgi:hypothetical protein
VRFCFAPISSSPSSRKTGRIAPQLGDTARAIDAYSRFVAVRDLPDPGPVQREVAAIRRQLSELRTSRHRGKIAIATR